jgi:UDP-N-acetylmuramate--alanine ligase
VTEFEGRRLWFVAIGGAGMSGLALACHRLGAVVGGSDRAESSYMERVRDAGLEPRLGHDAEAVPVDAEIVVSTAVPEDNPELARARARRQRILHRSELMAEVCAQKLTLAVAGTHGKTTTAAMIVHAMRAAGADPAFLIGGELRGTDGGPSTNAGWGEGEWIVAEADESDGSFLRLSPELATITNVELDHHSNWSSRAELHEAFGRFIRPARGIAVPASLATSLEPESGDRRLVLTFGIENGPARNGAVDFIARDVRGGPEGTLFVIERESAPSLTVSLPQPGRHNVLNCVCALAAVELAGLEVAAAAAAMATFPGVARRLERVGERDGARVYDDYAHHPTEIAAALSAARELEPRRLIAAFQPHLYSRTKVLARQFGAALAGGADEIAVLEVYPAREQPVGELAGVSGKAVADAAADSAAGRPVWWLPDRERAAAALADRLRPGDLLLTLGAGDINLLAESLVEGGGRPEPKGGPHERP